ncbi:gastrula zinc finger protein XlCGF66.1-like isoform X4 [Pyxicephalus adspersus]|uniref:gastrula zinc finger protein XlCGF66.1-like isoform X4 n=1 Tax=Pyxicephalus adspersus TaxID=30357 RepID=UPI003B59138B
MTYPQRMEKERSKITDRILNLTLDIIYLLTGENYIAFKLSDGLVASNLMKTQNPVLEPPSHSLRQKKKKVKEVTSEIIELLTGEVPIRCQDVTVYFSMEEWEYLEGHKDLYKDVMMEEHQTLTSPDGFSNGNPPERCPRPLYSQDTRQEHREDQIEDLMIIKAEPIDEEEMYVSGVEPCKEKQIPVKISTDDQYHRNKTRNCSISCSDGEIEEYDIVVDSPEINEQLSGMNLEPVLYSAGLSSDPSAPWECFPHHSHSTHRSPKKFACSECGKCFTQKSHVTRHEKVHSDVKPYSCSICGRCYAHKSHLTSHLRSHTDEKWHSCPECGICFGHKGSLIRHQRIHTNEKTFSCTECGRSFTQKSHLVDHFRIHTGEKPYLCLQCGKRFAVKRGLVSHEKIHSGQKLFSCSDCGKFFTRNSYLINHRRIHQREVLV